MAVFVKTKTVEVTGAVRPRRSGGGVRPCRESCASGRALPRLLLGIGLSYLPVAIALPLLPGLIVEHGGGAGAVGVVIGAESVTATLVRPTAGWLAAVRSRRTLFAAACVLVAIATAANAVLAAIWLLALARLLLGIGSGAARALAHGWAVELVDHSRRGRSLGLVGLATELAVALGPPLGFVLSNAVGIEAAWLLAAASALLGAVAVNGLPEPPRAPAPARLGRRALALSLRTGTGIAISFAAYAALAAFATVALTGRGIAGGSAVLTAYACSVVLTRLLAGGASDRFGARRTALVSAALEASGLLVLATAGTLTLAVTAGALVGCGIANLYPSLALLALERRSQQERSLIAASLGSFIDIGVAVGAPIAGLLASRVGYNATFIVLAASALATVGTIVARLRRPKRSGRRPPLRPAHVHGRSSWASMRASVSSIEATGSGTG